VTKLTCKKQVWGGDAITLDGTSNIWVDHVRTSNIGRQHIVTGNGQNTAITISNNFVDGVTKTSATCSTYHYWGVYMTGKNDQITFKNNYIHHTSGRSPKLGGGATVHIVNNYWDENQGHALEGENSYALIEGNVFQDVKIPEQDWSGQLYAPSSNDAKCKTYLGRACVANSYTGSGRLSGSATGVLSKIGKNAASAKPTSDIGDIPYTAGNTL
jgi:pectin lyase